MHILIVEDDPNLVASLEAGLDHAGYQHTLAPTVPAARKELTQTKFDAVLLDLELPGGDGLDILQELRAEDDPVPVLIMTGGRTQLEDRVEGLDSGADDYLLKPFDFPELMARLHAVVRRSRAEGDALVYQVADLRIDAATRKVTRGNDELDLTDREFELLAYLARKKGHVATREQLAQDVWKETSRATSLDNVVDVHISHLRKKIDENREPKLIQTIRGKGFKLST